MRKLVCSLMAAVSVMAVGAGVCSAAPAYTDQVEQINAWIRLENWQPVMSMIRQQPILAQSKDIMGDTPLHYAAQMGFQQLGGWLISVGAKVNSQNYSGQTPVMVAADYGQSAMCKMLISKGANVRTPDQDGLTPLHVAGNAATASVLLASGAAIEARDNHALTPIFHAVANGRVDVLRVLMGAGANTSVRDKEGHTLVDWAHRCKNRQIASELQSAGVR